MKHKRHVMKTLCSPTIERRGLFIALQRFARFLTLACFFHFSGLNNGFTCMVESSGTVQAGFAPVAIQQVARALNPVRWAELASKGSWLHIFSRSSRVIEIASQQALESMFAESTLFQVWVNHSVKTVASGAKSAVRQAIPNAEQWSKTDETLSSAEPAADLRGRLDYLTSAHEESWIKMERAHFTELGKTRLSHPAALWNGGAHPNGETVSSQSILRLKLARAGPARRQVQRRIVHVSAQDGEASAQYHLTETAS